MSDALFPEDEVDTTAKYVPHETWKLFGDDVLISPGKSDRLPSTDTESTETNS